MGEGERVGREQGRMLVTGGSGSPRLVLGVLILFGVL
jgi:hypothetical protein